MATTPARYMIEAFEHGWGEWDYADDELSAYRIARTIRREYGLPSRVIDTHDGMRIVYAL